MKRNKKIFQKGKKRGGRREEDGVDHKNEELLTNISDRSIFKYLFPVDHDFEV